MIRATIPVPRLAANLRAAGLAGILLSNAAQPLAATGDYPPPPGPYPFTVPAAPGGASSEPASAPRAAGGGFAPTDPGATAAPDAGYGAANLFGSAPARAPDAGQPAPVRRPASPSDLSMDFRRQGQTPYAAPTAAGRGASVAPGYGAGYPAYGGGYGRYPAYAPPANPAAPTMHRPAAPYPGARMPTGVAGPAARPASAPPATQGGAAARQPETVFRPADAVGGG